MFAHQEDILEAAANKQKKAGKAPAGGSMGSEHKDEGVSVPDANNHKGSIARPAFNISGFSHSVQKMLFNIYTYRLLLLVLVIAATLMIAALAVNPAVLPAVVGGVVGSIVALGIFKLVFGLSAAVAPVSALLLAQSFKDSKLPSFRDMKLPTMFTRNVEETATAQAPANMFTDNNVNVEETAAAQAKANQQAFSMFTDNNVNVEKTGTDKPPTKANQQAFSTMSMGLGSNGNGV